MAEQVIESSLFAPRKKKVGGVQITFTVLKYAFLVILVAFLLMPTFTMVCLSFLPENYSGLGYLFAPKGGGTFEYYKTILSSGSGYVTYLLNTLMVGGIVAVGIPLTSALCAFGFSKIEFRGRNIYFAIVLSTMMIPAVVTIVPLYIIFDRLDWVNTLFPMWVPSLFGGGATNIFLMRQFMRGIPNDLLKAAKLDGANVVVIFFRIMLPLCVPILLYVAVTSFMGAWNDFMTPFTYVNMGNKESFTLALGIYYDYCRSTRQPESMAMASGVIMTIPCAVLFFVFQKYLVDGVAGSGMKD